MAQAGWLGIEAGRISWAGILNGLSGALAGAMIALVVVWLSNRHSRRLARDQNMILAISRMLAQVNDPARFWDNIAQRDARILSVVADVRQVGMWLRGYRGNGKPVLGSRANVVRWAIAEIGADRDEFLRACGSTPVNMPRPDPLSSGLTSTARAAGVLMLWAQRGFPRMSDAKLDLEKAKATMFVQGMATARLGSAPTAGASSSPGSPGGVGKQMPVHAVEVDDQHQGGEREPGVQD